MSTKKEGHVPETPDVMTCVIVALSSKIVMFLCALLMILLVVQMSLMMYETQHLFEITNEYKPKLICMVMDDEKAANEYNAYLKKFNKSYECTELLRRFKIFKESLKEIEKLNEEHHQRPGGARFGLTFFSDISDEEFFPSRSNTYGKCDEGSKTRIDKTQSKYLQSKIDWRTKNFVGPVLDQKYCNGCWAFSIIGVLESMFAILHGKLYAFSIQQLLDCAKKDGCSGGHVLTGINWLMHPNPVVTEDEYPLTLLNETCRSHEMHGHVTYLKYFKTYCEPSITTILETLTVGPLIAVVNPLPWKHYLDGVIELACPTANRVNVLHAIQIVGYDLSPVAHYIIRNSWGEDFGEKGYVRVGIYNGETRNNLCGIRNEIYSLTV